MIFMHWSARERSNDMTELAERDVTTVESGRPDDTARPSVLDEVPRFDGRPVPDLRTAIPGPKARAHVEFDHRFTSPSLPRAYPIVPVRGRGASIEDIDGNLFLDFTAGIAVSSTGYAHPRVTAAVCAKALPFRMVAVVLRVMLASARIFPSNEVPVSSVAECTWYTASR